MIFKKWSQDSLILSSEMWTFLFFFPLWQKILKRSHWAEDQKGIYWSFHWPLWNRHSQSCIILWTNQFIDLLSQINQLQRYLLAAALQYFQFYIWKSEKIKNPHLFHVTELNKLAELSSAASRTCSEKVCRLSSLDGGCATVAGRGIKSAGL